MYARCAALTAAIAAPLAVSTLDVSSLGAQIHPPARPQVFAPFSGDPRLERIPAFPQHLADFEVFGDGLRLRMRFPPRVNGQTHSDGDGHADLFVFFDETTGLPVQGQLPVLEAVPKGAVAGVSDLVARRFSAIWEMTPVVLGAGYDPADPLVRIDSFEKVFSSPFTRRVYTTNMFLNCPVVAAGSSVAPGSPPLEQAWFGGQQVTLAPYDVDDGTAHPQVMFRFVDAAGHVLPDPDQPHLVLSHVPGEPFYTSIWEVWSVTVPPGFPYTDLRSVEDVKNSALPVTSAHIRLNCPVVAVEDAPGSGTFAPMHFENAFDLLRNDFAQGPGRFAPDAFRVDLPRGTTATFQRDGAGEPIGRGAAPAPFAHARTFLITFVDLFPQPVFEPLFGLGLQFPQVALGGNVVPLILQRPHALWPQNQWLPTSSPDTTGAVIRFGQAELDAAYRNHFPPRLPPAIEQNIQGFIQNGLMDPSWAPGARPYAQRLALVGQALHELVWRPEQGIQSRDTTSCVACHSLPASGGASRGLYTLEARAAHGGLMDTLNGGSMFGGGAAELLAEELRQRGEPVTFAHGSTGERDALRHFVSRASNEHFGIQSSEEVAELTGLPLAAAALTDQDGDGVVEEMTTGEVTAQAAFLLGLPVPDQASVVALRAMGISIESVFRGRQLFRRSIGAGGAGCAACHVPFHRLQRTVFPLANPETGNVISVPVASHLAEQDDVDEGLAQFVGDQGLRTYGDFRLHEMGSLMRSAGASSTDLLKTAELWDVGSTYPLLRGGDAGSDLRAAIAAHAGVAAPVTIDVAPVSRAAESRRRYVVKITNPTASTIAASEKQPLRLVLVGPMAPATAIAEFVDGTAPDGTAREGCWWRIDAPIPPGGTVTRTLSFRTQSRLPLRFELALCDDDGFSEAIAAARAFAALAPADQQGIVDFLRAQLIGDRPGE
ncbi:MAG: hypothetical protein AB7O97_14450 [Planctomycetota bacterium]